MSEPGVPSTPAAASARGRVTAPARRPPCGAGSGSPTGAPSAASWRQNATGRCSSACSTRRSDGLVELAAGTRRDGTLQIDTRARADHFLPGGGTGHERWLEASARARGHTRGPRRGAVRRTTQCARSHAVTSTPSRTPGRCGSTSTSPDSCTTCGRSSPRGPAICCSRAAARGVHAYWLLDRPLPATRVDDRRSGWRVEPIERAHARLIHHLGVDQHGRPNVADPACRKIAARLDAPAAAR